MCGNTWEWTADWFFGRHAADAAKACCIPRNPRGPRMEDSMDPLDATRIQRQSGCDERDNQDEIARLDFGMIVAIFGFCNA
jgi:formylglycine-generating enzyme required for sulfatase activity